MGISAFSTFSNVSTSARLATRLAIDSMAPHLLWRHEPLGSESATQPDEPGANGVNAYCKAIPSLRASHPLAGNPLRARSRRLSGLANTSPLPRAFNAPGACTGFGHEGTSSPPSGSPVIVSRLRVLREFEPGKHPAAAGRMVISGRMVDVCAELDRLVGAESAH